MDWMKMTDEKFAASVIARPWASLEYEHACARMTDEQFAASVIARPWASRVYEHACARRKQLGI